MPETDGPKITRLYRVRIKPELREAFEPLFQTVAKDAVAQRDGCLRVVLGGPTTASTDEYWVLSDWRDVASLTAFAGPDWSQAHIPAGMERFVDACWVYHFSHAFPEASE